MVMKNSDSIPDIVFHCPKSLRNPIARSCSFRRLSIGSCSDMSVLDYIEETSPTEVRQLLLAAHLFLQESLPPFTTCAIKWRIPFYSLRRNFCYLNRHRDHITLGFPHGHRLAPQPGRL